MPRGRPKPPAPPPPPVEDEQPTDPDADDGAGADPDAPDEQPEASPDEAPRPGHKPSPLDEQVGSPGGGAAVRFQPGFGIPARPPGEGHNHIGPLPFVIGGGARPSAQAERPQREPYVQGADPIESEVQEQSDGALSKAFLGQYPGDMRVDIEVWQVDGAQTIPRGRLENVMLSYGRVPTRFIPWGGFGGSGQWQLEYYSAMTGKFLQRRKVTLPGEEPPAGYRVENVLAEQEILKALARALAGGGTSTGGIPLGAYTDEKAWLREQIADQKKMLDTMRADFERRDREAERQRFEDRIRLLESGGAGGGQNQVLQTITALAPFMQQGRSGDDRLVDIVLQMNGPGMMQAQAGMYNSILEAAAKFKGGDGDGGLKGMIGGALKGAVEKYMDGMQKRQEAHDAFMRKRQDKKDAEEARRESGGQQPAATVPPAGQPAAQPGNGSSDDKRLFARLIRDVREAMQRVGDANVPAAEKPSVKDVATKFVLCFRTSIELGLHKADPMIDEMTSAILANPELFIAKWCAAYGPGADFGAQVAKLFREMTDLPPLEQPKPPVSPAPPVSPPQPSSEPEAPVETSSSTIRLPSSSQGKPMAPAVVDAGSTSPAPAAAVEPSAKVKREDAEVGQVAEPKGPVHVVDARPEAAAGQGVQEGDALGEVREPPQQDGGGLVDTAHPAGKVEQPVVPGPPGVVVEPHNP